MRTDTEIEELAFRQLAFAHPHECYASDPERFWRYYHEICPDVTREHMEQALAATEE